MPPLVVVRPRIVAFDTRAELGMVAPRSVSHNIDTLPGGAGVHYGGPSSAIRSHLDCQALWRAWQRMHMDAPRNWVDIAYTGGFCNHGHALAGRGLGVRTAAQGTNDGNDRYHAYVWLNGGETPTELALGALGWWVAQGRAAGGGLDVRPHQTFHPTSCPGAVLVQYAKLIDGKALLGGAPTSSDKRRVCVLGTQRAVHVAADGLWGQLTDRAVLAVRGLRDGHGTKAEVLAAQRACGTNADGAWGPASVRAFHQTVTGLQRAWKLLVPALAVDGEWGPATDRAWATVRGQLNGK